MIDPWNNPAMWHAINVHLPLALALFGVPLVCVVAITRARSTALRWGAVGFYILLIASAWYATQTGEKAVEQLPSQLPAGAWDRVNQHEWMAERIWIFGVATLALLVLTNIPRRWARQSFSTLAVVASVLTGGWVILTGHSGGVAVYEYGLGTAALKASVIDESHARAPSPAPEGADEPAPTVPATITTPTSMAPVSYVHDIQPLLTARCVECHAGEKAKGGFEVTSVAAMSRSGRKAGPGIVPGQPEQSAIIQYVLGHREPRMPKGAAPLPHEEVELIRAWIAGGAIDDSQGTPAPAPAEPALPPSPPDQVASQSPAAWDPPVNWHSAEMAPLRRFVRLQQIPPVPLPSGIDPSHANPIDGFIEAKWKDASDPHLTPQLCDDATFVRRVYLDVIGMIPTAEQAQQFCDDTDPDKRAKLIDELLDREQDYAAHWVPFWEDALCSNGSHQGGVGTHGNYRKWIFDNFVDNKPYDTMVLELLDPAMPNHPPRYVLNDSHMRTIQSASDTAQVFLGTAIKCASCHSHFENPEWPQARAVAFAGFFSNRDMELIRCEQPTGQFIPTSFMFDLPGAPADVPEDQAARLQRVAQLIVDPANPRFARTIVNRLWKRYLGLGLFEPADDYRADTGVSHPQLLAWLADDFMRNGYNLKHTIRLILTSRTYQLRYDPALEDRFDVARPDEPRFFRSPALRRLTAEQLLDSLAAAVNAPPPTDQRTYNNDASTVLTRALGRPSSRHEVSTARPDETAVVQALELLNGQEYYNRIYNGAAMQALRSIRSPEELVQRLYWTALNRAPADAELRTGAAFLGSATTSPPPATVIDIWFDDDLPPGVQTKGNWHWKGEPDHPVFSGKLSHTVGIGPVERVQQYFNGASFEVSPGDVLFAHVYIDPQDPPRQIMLQWHSQSWNHRAYWGEDVIAFSPRTAKGPLPPAGQWVRLEVPAHEVGFTQPTKVTGMSFDQARGNVYWDRGGVVHNPPVYAAETIGDVLWVLLSTPEFHYIR